MTAYTPDPTSHVLDANLASNPQRMLSGGKTGSRHAQGSHRLGRAVSLWRLWLLGLGFLTLFTIIGAKIVHLACSLKAASRSHHHRQARHRRAGIPPQPTHRPQRPPALGQRLSKGGLRRAGEDR